MKIAMGIVALLVSAAVVIVVIGTRLPVKHVASRAIHLQRPPAEVYAAVRDFAAFPQWRPDVKRVEILGASMFREHASHGAVTYEVLEDVPNEKLVTRIADQDLGYSGSWTYTIQPEGNGTLLRITEHGEVPNPLFRFLSRYVFGHTATMDRYLEALAKRYQRLSS